MMDNAYASIAYLYKCSDPEKSLRTPEEMTCTGMNIWDSCKLIPEERSGSTESEKQCLRGLRLPYSIGECGLFPECRVPGRFGKPWLRQWLREHLKRKRRNANRIRHLVRFQTWTTCSLKELTLSFCRPVRIKKTMQNSCPFVNSAARTKSRSRSLWILTRSRRRCTYCSRSYRITRKRLRLPWNLTNLVTPEMCATLQSAPCWKVRTNQGRHAW